MPTRSRKRRYLQRRLLRLPVLALVALFAVCLVLHLRASRELARLSARVNRMAAGAAGVVTSRSMDQPPRNTREPEARRVELNGRFFDVVEVDTRVDDLRIHWRTPSGDRFGSLGRVRDALAAENRELLFATNAGMFAPDFTPVGLYVEDSETRVSLNTRDSTGGNFYLKPNGVFFVAGDSAGILETSEFLRLKPAEVTLATQSGPMLVQRGRIHTAFREGSTNRFIRSGVGVRDGHVAVFAISRAEVDFHTIATLFRDVLDCQDALFLDGAISRMYAPALDRTDTDGDFAGILSVSAQR